MIKSISLKSTVVTLLLLSNVCVFGQERIVPYTEIPPQIQAYIKNYFPNNKILQSEIDYEGLTKEYDIILSENIELEFNRNEQIKSISSISKLPDAVIPEAIRNYIKANYQNNFVTKWELEKTYQSIKLDNSIKLKFTLKNEFLKIDN